MKKLLGISLIMLLTACGNNGDGKKEPSDQQSSKNSTIGTAIRLGSIEIAEKDLPEMMTWDKAKAACEALGPGWRLPTKDELNNMQQNQDHIGDFTESNYWSSTEYDASSVWTAYFVNKNISGTMLNMRSAEFHVRAVRTF